jgi:hypothetical protein
VKAIQEQSTESEVSESRQAKPEQTRTWQGFALILGCSLLLRILVLWAVAGTPLASDSQDYRGMALRLLQGDHFVPYWPPGLPLYLAPFLAAGFGDIVLRASMLAWWILFCVGWVRLGRDLGVKTNTLLLLLAVFSVTPALIHFSVEPMTQLPSAVLLLLAVSASVRCWKGAGWREALLLGGTMGGLALIRPSALPLMVAFPALIYLSRRRFTEPMIAITLGAVMILAWVAKVHQLSGQWTINNSNGANLYYGNNPWTPLYRTWYFGSHAKVGTDEILQFPEYETIVRQITALPETERGAAFQKKAVEYVLHRPDLFLLRTINRVRCFWGFDIFTAANLRETDPTASRWFVPVFSMDAACYLMIAGFAFYWIAAAPALFWARWETWLLTTTVVLYALPYWVTMSHPTYHFPVMAPLALLGALAWQLVRSSGTGSRARGWAALVMLALIQVEWAFYLAQG